MLLLAASLLAPFARGAPCADPDACFRLGVEAQAERQDFADSAALYEVACRAGHGLACVNLATQLQRGLGVASDLPRAEALLRQGCTASLGLACGALGVMLADPGRKADAEAREVLDRGCTLGHAPACTTLGTLLEAGLGGPADSSGAARSYDRACQAGDGQGCWMSVRRRVAGTGPLAPDDLRRLERGCQAQVADACGAAGWLYQEGVRLPRDADRAEAFMRQACTLEPTRCR